MEGEGGAPRSIIDELHSWDIQGDQIEGESGVTGSIVDELHSSDIQGDQMEGASGVSPSIIHELHSRDIQRDEMERENVLLDVSSMNFILWISKEIKWKAAKRRYSKYHR